MILKEFRLEIYIIVLLFFIYLEGSIELKLLFKVNVIRIGSKLENRHSLFNKWHKKIKDFKADYSTYLFYLF